MVKGEPVEEAEYVTRIVWANPQARYGFNILLIVNGLIVIWTFVLALIFGGGFWMGLVIGIVSLLALYVLSEFTGAYEEVAVRIATEGKDAEE